MFCVYYLCIKHCDMAIRRQRKGSGREKKYKKTDKKESVSEDETKDKKQNKNDNEFNVDEDKGSASSVAVNYLSPPPYIDYSFPLVIDCPSIICKLLKNCMCGGYGFIKTPNSEASGSADIHSFYQSHIDCQLPSESNCPTKECKLLRECICGHYASSVKPFSQAAYPGGKPSTAVSGAVGVSAGGDLQAPPPPPWEGRAIATHKLRLVEFSAFMEHQREPDTVSVIL